MNDYNTILNEYQDLKNTITNQARDLTFILGKMNCYKSGILFLEENMKTTTNHTSGELEFINGIFGECAQQIKKLYKPFDDQIVKPLNNFISSFKTSSKDNLLKFNKIKDNLLEGKQKLNQSKEEYYNYIRANQKKMKDKKDENELFHATKGNYAQLYKYEITKMNELIKNNNGIYIEIYDIFNSVNTCIYSVMKEILLKFSQNAEKIGKIFIKFSENIKKGLEDNISRLEKTKKYIPLNSE